MVKRQLFYSGLMLAATFALASFAGAAPISVPDPNLERALEEAMGLTVQIDGVIDDSNFIGFTELSARGRNIASLTGLEAASDLISLDLRINDVVSVAPLSGLSSLRNLDLGFNDVEDVSPLAGLTGLEQLDLGFGSPFNDEETEEGPNFLEITNDVTDISPLAGLVNLKYLNLGGNPNLTSIAAISGMSSLEQLVVGGPIADFTPLASRADSLAVLLISNTGTFDDSAIPAVNTLTNLWGLALLFEPNLTSIDGLTDLDLRLFAMVFTQVSSIQVMSNYVNLELFLGQFNRFASLDGLQGLTKLEEVSVNDGLVQDISALVGNTSLRSLELGANQISDISALATVTELEFLRVDHNQITDIQALIDNPGLGGDDSVAIEFNPLSQFASCEQLPVLLEKFNNPENVTHTAVCGGFTLTINVVGDGNVSPGPGSTTYVPGSNVFVHAYPLANSGYAYFRTTGAISTTEPEFSILMDADKEIDVEFVNTGNIRTLTLSRGGSVSGDIGPGLGAFSYLDGRTARIMAIPHGNSFFAGWSGDVVSARVQESIVMDGDKAIIGTFSSIGFTLTVASEGGGTTNPFMGMYRYAAGLIVPLEAVTGPGAVFSHWTGPVADPLSAFTSVTISSTATVTAVFLPGTIQLQISTVGNGTTNPTPGIHYFFPEDTAFLQAIPASDSAFVRWTGDIGAANAFSPSIFLPMSENRSVTAEFAPYDFTLTIGVTGDGTTSPAPGTYGFLSGQSTTVSAIASGNDVFGGWSGDLGTADSESLTIDLIMDRNRNVSAEFFTPDFFLTITAPTGSGASFPASGVYGYVGGTTALLRARPSAGSRFAGWQGDFEAAVPAALILMDGDKTVTPVFEAFPAAPIVFADPNFEQVIRIQIGKPVGDIFPADLAGQFQVQTGNANVGNLQGLEYFTHIFRFNGFNNPLSDISQVSELVSLSASDIASCQVTDISPYNHLPFLEDLNFGANLVSDLSGLTVLPSLRRLVAFENDIADISTLANFRTLRELNLNDNEVTDLSPLAGLINLERLRMLNNDVQSVAPLANLLNLRTIALAGSTSLSDISGLAGLTQLQELDLSRCAVSDISALQGLPDLTFVSLISNQVTDLTPLLNNPGFGMDDQLFISGNPLSQAAACEQALELEARGVLVIGAVCDQDAPIITRTGQAVVAVALQSIYTDAGATAFDNQEGNLTGAIVVTNPVNTFAAGTYIVRYNVMDSLGNAAAEVTRTVHVVPSEILLPFQLQLLISGFNGVDTNQDGKLGLAELQARIPGITQNDLGARDLDLSGGLELTELILATYPGPVHTGDRDADGRFILSEVLRLVQFYNSGGHHCAPGTEDGYAPGPGSTACLRHAADVLPNFIINLTELLRVIQLFNSGGYAACPAQQTEDGYCPGFQ